MSQKEEQQKEEKGAAPGADIGRLMEGLGSPLTGLIASTGALLTGVGLLADDAADFGKLGHERDPPLPHHWIYGVLIMMGGAAGMGFSLLRLLQSTPPPAAKLPRSLLEGADSETLDRFK